MHNQRSLLFGLLTCLAVLGSAFVFPGAAQAYDPDPSAPYVKVDTNSSCTSSGTLNDAVYLGGKCFHDDTYDNTYFKLDAGAKALKIELRVGSSLIGKVEFHPWDEILWLYDILADGDTIYVACRDQTAGSDCYPGVRRASTPTGDPNVLNLNIPDGHQVLITIYDNAQVDVNGFLQGSDFIASNTAIA
jgi:hypothetical protein